MFQPADVGLQRYLKHHVKRSATDFISASATRELSNGVPVNQIKLPTDLPTLRNASIAWLLDGYKFFTENRDIVKNAWAQSKVAGLSLTWSSLTSEEALKNLNLLRKSDPAFNQEFARFDFKALATVSGDLNADKEVITGGNCEFADDDTSLSTGELITRCSEPSSAEGSEQVQHEDFLPVCEQETEWPGFYPPDIAIQGGTNFAYHQTVEDARVTDKATRKRKQKQKAQEGEEVVGEVTTKKRKQKNQGEEGKPQPTAKKSRK